MEAVEYFDFSVLTTDCRHCDPVGTPIMKSLNKFIWLNCEMSCTVWHLCSGTPWSCWTGLQALFEQHSSVSHSFPSKIALSAMLSVTRSLFIHGCWHLLLSPLRSSNVTTIFSLDSVLKCDCHYLNRSKKALSLIAEHRSCSANL